jgi:hypothetical protein
MIEVFRGLNGYDLHGFAFELQIRTMGASLWADVSHDLTYKAPEGGVPREVDRAILRLAAVLELVDQEADRVRQVVASAKDADQQTILRAIEKQFLQLAARDYDHELTEALLPQLMWVVGDSTPDEFVGKLNEFFTRCREKLEFVFDQYKDVGFHPVLHQPEALLILYAREYQQIALQENWPPLLPETEREDFEAIWQPSRS